MGKGKKEKWGRWWKKGKIGENRRADGWRTNRGKVNVDGGVHGRHMGVHVGGKG